MVPNWQTDPEDVMCLYMCMCVCNQKAHTIHGNMDGAGKSV